MVVPIGLDIHPTTGVFSGTPTSADAQALQPIELVLSVIAADGSKVETPFQLRVTQVNTPPEPIPVAEPQRAVEGMNFVFPMEPYFNDIDRDTLTFEIRGLPSGSGFRINHRTGLVSGLAGPADLAVSPINAEVCAYDGQATTCNQLIVSVVEAVPRNKPPEVGSIPDGNAFEGALFTQDLSEHVKDADFDPLKFSLQGLPVGSGFNINTFTGVVSGTPRAADLEAVQPLHLILLASDGNLGGRAEGPFHLHVHRANRGPVAYPIPLAFATVGQVLSLDVSPYFADEDRDQLTFSFARLHDNSGLSIDANTGVVTGIPNFHDAAQAQPLTLLVNVFDGTVACHKPPEFKIIVMEIEFFHVPYFNTHAY